jgi:hypothetical protein
MSYGWATYDENTIKRLKAQGRGAGTGSAYHPWLTVRDVSSLGLSTRSKGWKTGRQHHVLSNLELCFFFCLEWAVWVTDIREQFPLPLEDTTRIAEQMGVQHPRHPKSKNLVVMTTDFLITHARDGVETNRARSVKPARNLASRRTLEKLEIERFYWAEQGVDWGIVTEQELSIALAKNVELIHAYRTYPSYCHLTPQELSEVARLLTNEVQTSPEPLRRCTSACDRTLGLEMGTALAVAYYLIATHQWRIDMYSPIDPTETLVLQDANLNA